MHLAKPMMNPMAQSFKLSSKDSPETDEESRYMEKVPFETCVGILMYAMICSRPDLGYAISLVS